MLGKILVSLNGTDTSERVIPQVKGLLRPDGEIVLCVPLAAFRPSQSRTRIGLQSLRDQAERYVSKRVMKLKSDGFRAYGVLAQGRSIAQSVLRSAMKEHATMIALACPGSSNDPMKAEAMAIVDGSRIPVLGFPWGTKSNSSVSAPEQILLPLQEETQARVMIPDVAELARTFGSQVTVLHVMPSSHSDQDRFPAMKREVDRAATQFAVRDIVVRWRIRRGRPHDEIPRLAGEYLADLLVVPPAIAVEILEKSDVPVLSIPSSQESLPIAKRSPA